MRTVGVDLSAEPDKTAVATVEWSGGAAVVTALAEKADDAVVIEAVANAEKSGIDCPFGWPLPFVEFVTAHRDGHVTGHPEYQGIAWRRTLANRMTDLQVAKRPGLRPLSVAADRIGHAALRCAWLLSELDRAGVDVDRAGNGAVVEVYPAASLLRWGLVNGRYKGAANRQARDDLVRALRAAAPWLELGPYEDACRRSDDAFDAVVAALSARAATLGLVTAPTDDQAETARVEGWIAVPTCGLDELR